jgi:hypothetical protein
MDPPGRMAGRPNPPRAGRPGGVAEVPGVGWVSRFAEQCGDCTRHGHALVELDAITGLRWGEIAVLTADPQMAADGEGTWSTWAAASWRSWQLSDSGDTPTVDSSKAGRARRIVVPPARTSPAGSTSSAGSRHGSRSKTVLTEIGPVEIDVPRDVDASFAPQIAEVAATPAERRGRDRVVADRARADDRGDLVPLR